MIQPEACMDKPEDVDCAAVKAESISRSFFLDFWKFQKLKISILDFGNFLLNPGGNSWKLAYQDKIFMEIYQEVFLWSKPPLEHIRTFI